MKPAAGGLADSSPSPLLFVLAIHILNIITVMYNLPNYLVTYLKIYSLTHSLTYLLPTCASEQGKVIGLVSVYIFILYLFLVVFSIMRSVRYFVIFHRCYQMLYYTCAVPVEYRINHLSHSFRMRYCGTFHLPLAREISRSPLACEIRVCTKKIVI